MCWATILSLSSGNQYPWVQKICYHNLKTVEYKQTASIEKSYIGFGCEILSSYKLRNQQIRTRSVIVSSTNHSRRFSGIWNRWNQMHATIWMIILKRSVFELNASTADSRFNADTVHMINELALFPNSPPHAHTLLTANFCLRKYVQLKLLINF